MIFSHFGYPFTGNRAWFSAPGLVLIYFCQFRRIIFLITSGRAGIEEWLSRLYTGFILLIRSLRIVIEARPEMLEPHVWRLSKQRGCEEVNIGISTPECGVTALVDTLMASLQNKESSRAGRIH